MSRINLFLAALAAAAVWPACAVDSSIQDRFFTNHDSVAQACRSLCASRIVGTYRCSDAEFVKCVYDGTRRKIDESVSRAGYDQSIRTHCFVDGAYKFSAISELFSVEECERTAEQRIASIRKLEADAKADLEARRRRADDDARTAAAHRETVRADLKAGRRQPSTFAEQMLRDDVTDALSVVASPMATPDRALYGVVGVVSRLIGSDTVDATLVLDPQTEFALRSAGLFGKPLVVRIRAVDSGTLAAFKGHARIGAAFVAYGSYVSNAEEQDSTGRRLVVPVLNLSMYKGL